MKIARQITACFAVGTLLACAEEVPPPSVDELLDNRVLLDATMVRCSANRSSTKYSAECVNARDAANRIAKVEEEARRSELEAQSERKRRALRRTQEAANQARRRVAEAARLREEAAYLAQFDGSAGSTDVPEASSNYGDVQPAQSMPAPESLNTPGAVPDAVPDSPPEAPAEPAPANGTNLQSIRDELKRRQDGGQ